MRITERQRRLNNQREAERIARFMPQCDEFLGEPVDHIVPATAVTCTCGSYGRHDCTNDIDTCDTDPTSRDYRNDDEEVA